MKKMLLTLGLGVAVFSVHAQTLQRVWDAGRVSKRDDDNTVIQRVSAGPGGLSIIFKNADSTIRGAIGYNASNVNNFYINTTDGSPIFLQSRTIINNAIDDGQTGLQAKSGLSITGSNVNKGNQIRFKRSDGAEMAYIGWVADSLMNSPFLIKSSNGNDIRFRVNATDIMNLTTTGNVGIGTTTTGTNKLAVEGTIAARRLKITQATPWPDFVFLESYQLMPLTATARFIREYKHLPDIPSAAEVAREGIDVGEMNSKLLQKIEELTLHLIEQNERVAALEKEVKSLKKQ
ncbi:hypothetical protein [Chitinophaga sp. Ak27]|uniref:hypothetical protein n=2 Tax=Chitinophaga TaxID=79328 RepID=UPI00145CA022|nr:hypothetical protein [Chitinophaga sp. Ak27]NLU96461.1 hypothetical protein [Chitinophaga sp. Ak27]